MNTISRPIRIAVGLWIALLLFGIAKSVDSCRSYKADAKVWRDSTHFYKVAASRDCQDKIDSLKVWYNHQKREDAKTLKVLDDTAPGWLR